jgi:hypothetical protein
MLSFKDLPYKADICHKQNNHIEVMNHFSRLKDQVMKACRLIIFLRFKEGITGVSVT